LARTSGKKEKGKIFRRKEKGKEEKENRRIEKEMTVRLDFPFLTFS
jgi:hypothetical protein